MRKLPSLLTLCMEAIKNEILCGDDLLPVIYELPQYLFDCLLTYLPPLALQKLQEELPVSNWDDQEVADGCSRNYRKRKRCRNVNFETAWKTLYQSRWSGPVDCYPKQSKADLDLTPDWQQMYWETHLQDCLNEAVGIASLPSFDGHLGEIIISDSITEVIGCKGYKSDSTCNFLKLSHHCQKFIFYARQLRLQNVHCTAEACNLLRNSRLKSLELRWIKSKEHVEGLCKLLNQNCETLTSIEFIHCKLSSTLMDAIFDSLQTKGIHSHQIQHFSIKTSRFIETNSSSLPIGLASFLSSARSLSSLSFCDDHLGPKFAEMIFKSLLEASSSVSILDLSENKIAGWLSHFQRRASNTSHLSLGFSKSLKSLRVLNLRGNNFEKADVESLKYALLHVPNLESLDLSDNPIEDDGIRSLIPYFNEMTGKECCLTDLKLENCELSSDGIIQLFRVLSILKRPLNSLSIADNELGSNVGAWLGKLMCTGIRSLNIEDVGLGPFGFIEAQKELMELKLVDINISKNRGGVEAANFLSKLISCAPDLVGVNAGYNFMPLESLSVILSSLKAAKGKLERLDLSGNTFCGQPIDASVLDEFQLGGKIVVILPSGPAVYTPYDDEP